jgi:hypothetical protein
MRNLKEACPAICDFSVRLDLPPRRWKYAWCTHELSAKRLCNAIRWRQPKIIVETGTFEGLGTITMEKCHDTSLSKTTSAGASYSRRPGRMAGFSNRPPRGGAQFWAQKKGYKQPLPQV